MLHNLGDVTHWLSAISHKNHLWARRVHQEEIFLKNQGTQQKLEFFQMGFLRMDIKKAHH